MKTKLFCELLERAFTDVTGSESNFDTVPYIPDNGGESLTCLGIFLLEDVHMAQVAAKAQHLLWADMSAASADDADIDEAMGDLADLISGMQIAPYMQWHCAYFPGLTADQVLSESEAGDERPLDMSGTGIELDKTRFLDNLRQELRAMHDATIITADVRDRAIKWIDDNPSEAASYDNMKVSEAADLIRDMVSM